MRLGPSPEFAATFPLLSPFRYTLLVLLQAPAHGDWQRVLQRRQLHPCHTGHPRQQGAAEVRWAWRGQPVDVHVLLPFEVSHPLLRHHRCGEG